MKERGKKNLGIVTRLTFDFLSGAKRERFVVLPARSALDKEFGSHPKAAKFERSKLRLVTASTAGPGK